jgi:hypothetical protein
MAVHVVDEMHAEMAALVLAHPTTYARLVAIAQMVFAMPDGDTRLMRHQIFEHLGEAHRARVAQAFWQGFFQPFTAVMSEGVALGDLHGDPVELAMLFSSLIEGAREWAANQVQPAERPPLPDVPVITPERIVDLFLHGVGRDKSR